MATHLSAVKKSTILGQIQRLALIPGIIHHQGPVMVMVKDMGPNLDEKTSKEVRLRPRLASSRDMRARIDSPVVVLT